VTSLPFERRTRVIFRKAEFGFFGVIVRTSKHTPRFCGHLSKTGDLLNFRFARRRLRTSWLIVGIGRLLSGNLAKTVETNKFTPLGTLVKGEKPRSKPAKDARNSFVGHDAGRGWFFCCSGRRRWCCVDEDVQLLTDEKSPARGIDCVDHLQDAG